MADQLPINIWDKKNFSFEKIKQAHENFEQEQDCFFELHFAFMHPTFRSGEELLNSLVRVEHFATEIHSLIR